MKVLTVKQPWAHLIGAGIKDVENRTWRCPEKYIGKRVLVHASARPCIGIYSIFSDDQKAFIFNNSQKSAIENIRTGVDVRNACKIVSSIIGSVEIVDCVVNYPSIWAEKSICCKDGCPDVENCPIGKCPHLIYNWVLANPILFDEPILGVKGRLGFWDYEV